MSNFPLALHVYIIIFCASTIHNTIEIHQQNQINIPISWSGIEFRKQYIILRKMIWFQMKTHFHNNAYSGLFFFFVFFVSFFVIFLHFLNPQQTGDETIW